MILDNDDQRMTYLAGLEVRAAKAKENYAAWCQRQGGGLVDIAKADAEGQYLWAAKNKAQRELSEFTAQFRNSTLVAQYATTDVAGA